MRSHRLLSEQMRNHRKKATEILTRQNANSPKVVIYLPKICQLQWTAMRIFLFGRTIYFTYVLTL